MNPLGDVDDGDSDDEADAPQVWTMRGLCDPRDTPYIGITYLTITDALARHYGLEQAQGVMITAVAPGSPAATAGLEPGDIILSLDRQVTDPNRSFVNILRQYRPGNKVTMAVLRRQEQQNVTVLLDKRPGG